MTRVPYGNFIRAVEIYGSLLTNSVNPPTVSFIHNVIRDGNYSGLRRKIIYSLREKSITARRNFSQLDPHGYYSSGYDLLIGPRKLNSALGKSLVWSASKISTCGHNEPRQWSVAFEQRISQHICIQIAVLPRHYITINRMKKRKKSTATVYDTVARNERLRLGTAYEQSYKAIINVDKEDIFQGNLDRARCGRR